MAEPGEREFATEVVRRLTGAGHQALFAGGCVRDELLGLEPDDYDVASSATPDQVRALFRRSIAVGASFGVIEVLGPPGLKGPLKVQVATFRTDGDYADGRRPLSVTFGSAREDALRRDFTINGMFLNPLTGEVLDHVGGRDDLRAGLLRAIGDPEKRFEEDRLRLARAVRMAARFGLALDPQTSTAIKRHASALTVVSAERVAEELRKMLRHPSRSTAVAMLESHGLLEQVLPELARHASHHPDHLPLVLRVLSRLPASVDFESAMACVLTGQPPATAVAVAKRLRLSNDEKDRVLWLLENEEVLEQAAGLPNHRLYPVLAHPWAEDLFTCSGARVGAMAKSASGLEAAASVLGSRSGAELDPPPLVDGADLQSIGIRPGPAMGRVLRKIREEQLDGLLSEKSQALDRAAALAGPG